MNARVFDPKEFTAALPRRPGVYRMFGAEHEILYVGKAKSLRSRLSNYFGPPRILAMGGFIVTMVAASVAMFNKRLRELH